MKRVLAAAAMMAALAAPAFAQFSGSGQQPQKTPLQLQYEREEQDQKANEKAYNDQMKRLKAQNPTAKSDPWAGVRPTNDTNAKR